MLAEVEAALAAEARGDGFYGVNKLSVNEFGLHDPRKLSRLESLDVFSEILSWEAFGGSEKHEERGGVNSKLGVVDSRPSGGGIESDDDDENDDLPATEKRGGDLLGGKPNARGIEDLHGVKGGNETKLPAFSGRGQSILKSKSHGREGGDALAKCTEDAGGDVEAASSEGAIQELLELCDRAPDLKERGDGAPSTGLSQLGEMEVDQKLMTALKSNVQWSDEHGSLRRGESGDEHSGGWFERSSRGGGNWQRPLGVRAESPRESQSSTLTYTGSGNRVSGNRLLSRVRPNSTPTSPILSPLPSPKTTFHSQSFKEPGQVGGYRRELVEVPKPQPGGENQRLRFSPQQQKTLHDFGTKVNWMGPGVESMEEAHQICADMSMDIKQLKKWISNHRPKELRSSSTPRPGVQPPWVIVPPLANSAFPGNYSEAALRGLNSAHPAMVGHPFYPPAPFFGGPQFPQGPWVPPPYGLGGQAMWPWAAPVGGGEQVPLDMARLANVDNLRQVLGRKLKDFDPGKVQKLVEICKTYRQKQSSNTSIERHDDPSNGKKQKQQLMSPRAVGNALLSAPPLDLDKATPQDEYRPQWGTTLLADPTPFGGRPDTLAANQAGWNMGDLAISSFRDASMLHNEGRVKAECRLPKPALAYPNPSPHGELPQASDQNFLGGHPWDDMSLLPFPPTPNQFLSHSAPAGSAPQSWPEPGFGNRFFYNPASHSAAFGANPPLEMGLPAGGLQRSATSGGKPPRTVRALRMRGGCATPHLGKDPKELRANKAPLQWDRGPVTQRPMRGKFLFEKVLTASDTSPLGRIILPKSQAELHLPKVLDKEGGLIMVEDADRNRWQLRYRFWPNNKSRVYVFEHTADFVASRGLRPGDYLVVCRVDEGHLILNDRRRPETPEGDPSERRAVSEGSRSTVSSGSSCTRGTPDARSASEHAERVTLTSFRTGPQLPPLQQVGRQLSMEEVARRAMSGDGHEMMDCVNLDHGEEPHVLELAQSRFACTVSRLSYFVCGDDRRSVLVRPVPLVLHGAGTCIASPPPKYFAKVTEKIDVDHPDVDCSLILVRTGL
ncbi:hypothetical protein KFL_002190030 [Klebsormidium nitens]|uniref:TF-B3 domain-containing protein n=1 Tax=Klebsormidium nitens TaxID=105231 RepID=A0A1Y1I6J6_KLENI|nr:hypothetical protein KFL_002190030 [Klebsormidium nitens]|eukprot:GAQ85049.1 hypothetical protein KFL_002190030 [Klebsormidium nitens]